MAWARLDDSMFAHPKFLGLTNSAVGLWARALSYAAGHLTDGHVPQAFVDRYGEASEATELLDVGLWKQNGSGYVIHDYADYQPSAAQVTAKRKAASDRMNTVRAKRGATSQ